jgi:putative hydrolase of the HAD superfamily
VLGDGMEPRRFDELFDSLYAHFARGCAWRLFDEVPSSLEVMRGKVRMFVVSNFDRRLRAILRGLGIAEFFEGVILSSEVGASKPHARMFQTALRAAGVAPQRCLHAGDEERADMLGAEAAGVPAMWIHRPTVTLRDVVEKVRPGTFSRLREARK